MGLFRRSEPEPEARPAGRHRADTPVDAPGRGSNRAGDRPPPPEPSPAVQELAMFALEHAVRSVVPEGGPLVPFALLDTRDGRSLARFVAELAEAQEHARQHVRESVGTACAAVAWDGYLTYEGDRSDAVFVEASAPGTPSVVLAHRYRHVDGIAEALGGPVLVGRGAPLL